MGNVTLPLGAANSGTNDWADVHNEVQAIVDVVNGNIENVNIKAAAGIVDSKLASPNNSVYRPLFRVDRPAAGITSAATWLPMINSSGAMIAQSGTISASGSPESFYFDDADYVVSGLTQKLRLRFQLQIGNALGVAPTSITAGLYPLTQSGGAISIGTVVTGSTAAISTFTADSTQSATASDFTIPSDGQYAVCFVYVGAGTYSTSYSLHAQLQHRSV